jgi:hypothetical protein
MNKEQVKECLVRDKGFLRELYENGNSAYRIKQILFTSNDSKLTTLIKFLHFLANGEIPIKAENFDALKANKRLTFIKKVILL